MVGPAARATGLSHDVRKDHPFSIFRFNHIPVSTWDTGDVFARAYIRWLEMQRSAQFLKNQLRSLPSGKLSVDAKPPRGGRFVVSLTEGWRGEILHAALTDSRGKFSIYKIVDPSFHNWMGLAMALRGQGISDFPVCNKSFNLSYCGHDL
jgi:Ni,Fe-hydrogenase III large subunit